MPTSVENYRYATYSLVVVLHVCAILSGISNYLSFKSNVYSEFKGKVNPEALNKLLLASSFLVLIVAVATGVIFITGWVGREEGGTGNAVI